MAAVSQTGAPGGQQYYYYPAYPPVPPKRNRLPLVVVALLTVVALAAVAFVGYVLDANRPTPPPLSTASSQGAPPTVDPVVTGSNTATPFCVAYTVFTLGLSVTWDQYTAARDAGDFATADRFVQSFLSGTKEMLRTGVPSDLRTSLNGMVAYLTKLDAALQKGGLSGITSSDSDGYNTAFRAFTDGAESYCYG